MMRSVVLLWKGPDATHAVIARAVKIRAHIIFNDTTHNAKQTVYFNTYQALLVVALKFQAYVREWSVKPGARAGFFTSEHSSSRVARTRLTVVRRPQTSFATSSTTSTRSSSPAPAQRQLETLVLERS